MRFCLTNDLKTCLVPLAILFFPSAGAFLPNHAPMSPIHHPVALPMSFPSEWSSQSTVLISSTETTLTSPTTDALSTTDIGVGVVLALLLAALASFLQGSSSSSFPNMVLWIRDMKEEQEEEKRMADAQAKMDQEIQEILSEQVQGEPTKNSTTTPTSTTATTTNTTKIDWDEMSRPENYIWYSNPNLRANQNPKAKATNDNRLAVFGLALVFVPIFGAELFLALSRQFLCESSSVLGNVWPWAQDLCAPIYRGG